MLESLSNYIQSIWRHPHLKYIFLKHRSNRVSQFEKKNIIVTYLHYLRHINQSILPVKITVEYQNKNLLVIDFKNKWTVFGKMMDNTFICWLWENNFKYCIYRYTWGNVCKKVLMSFWNPKIYYSVNRHTDPI